jgi:hypothetical protein
LPEKKLHDGREKERPGTGREAGLGYVLPQNAGYQPPVYTKEYMHVNIMASFIDRDQCP